MSNTTQNRPPAKDASPELLGTKIISFKTSKFAQSSRILSFPSNLDFIFSRLLNSMQLQSQVLQQSISASHLSFTGIRRRRWTKSCKLHQSLLRKEIGIILGPPHLRVIENQLHQGAGSMGIMTITETEHGCGTQVAHMQAISCILCMTLPVLKSTPCLFVHEILLPNYSCGIVLGF